MNEIPFPRNWSLLLIALIFFGGGAFTIYFYQNSQRQLTETNSVPAKEISPTPKRSWIYPTVTQTPSSSYFSSGK